ncbi:glycosyltransferase family 4 protein [Patescibacteria group bacterium]|nr:glycosyltransferase family 4 protein [Patescibacteria group bacterium]
MIIGIDGRNLEGGRTGVGRYLFNLLKEWSSFDLPNDLKFILYFKEEIPEDLSFLSNNFQSRNLASGWRSNAFFTHFVLPRAAKKDGIDLLFCPAYVAPLFYGGKIVLTLHDIIYQARPDLYNWPSVWDKILLKRFSKIAARKAEIIFVPSEYSKMEVLKYYQVDSERVFVTPLAADESFRRIDDENKLAEVKEKYGVKNKFIFYIGSIFNRRHLPEAIKAFGEIAGELPDYQFLIVGKNYTCFSMKSRGVLRKEYINSKDLPFLYNAADLLVWLSDYEGFGLPVLEALACGTPVITSPVASIPEVAGEAAIYIQDNYDIAEISEAMREALTDKSARQELISRGLEQAQKFSWKKCARETLDALLTKRL